MKTPALSTLKAKPHIYTPYLGIFKETCICINDPSGLAFTGSLETKLFEALQKFLSEKQNKNTANTKGSGNMEGTKNVYGPMIRFTAGISIRISIRMPRSSSSFLLYTEYDATLAARSCCILHLKFSSCLFLGGFPFSLLLLK